MACSKIDMASKTQEEGKTAPDHKHKHGTITGSDLTLSFLATDAKREIMPSLLVPMVKGKWEVDQFFKRNKALPKRNAKINIFA